MTRIMENTMDVYEIHAQKRRSAGELAKRSPLIALARMKPALWTRSHSPFPGLLIPRFQAETMRALPTTSQYAMASETVPQNIISAEPYGVSSEDGSSGVVSKSMHKSSLLNVSTALRRVVSVVNARFEPQGICADSANGPGAIGQYSSSEEEERALSGGRIWSHRYELFDHALRVKMDVDVNNVALFVEGP